MVSVSELLQRNKNSAETHAPANLISEMRNMDPKFLNHTVIITCCDGRIDPGKFFGQSDTVDFIPVRNVGGRAEFAIRDLLVLDTFVGVNDIMVVHHTDCGLTHITDKEVRKAVKEKVSGRDSELDNMKFGEIANLEETVQEDVKFLKASPYFKEELKVYGYIFDIKTGLLQTVVE